MLPFRDSRITKIALAAFFVIVVGYGYFEGRGLLFGPRIEISGRVQEVSEPLIMIEGSTSHIAALYMNGKQIAVTESGEYSEPYALAPGYNRIVLEARDKYGKSTERAIEIMYTPDPSKTPLPAPEATSTPGVAPESQ